jgi:hypothetical protein
MPCSPEESDDLTMKNRDVMMSWDTNEIFNENYGIFMGISWDIIHEHLIGYFIIDVVGHFCGTMIKGVMFEIEHEKHGLWSCS